MAPRVTLRVPPPTSMSARTREDMGPHVADSVNHFLRLAFEDPDRPDHRTAVELADKGIFDGLTPQLEKYGQVAVIIEPNINPACAYHVEGAERSFAVYLSIVLPYAAVVVSLKKRRFDGFLSQFLEEPWAAELSDLVRSWGFLVLPSDVLRAPSIIRDPDLGTVQSFFEALFEYEVDPPWDWDFRFDLGLAEGEYPAEARDAVDS